MLDQTLAQEFGRFRAAFNRASFLFHHELHLCPLFDIDEILGLADRLRPASAYYSTRPAKAEDGWEQNQNHVRTLQQTIAGIAQSDSLVMLKDIEQDVVFGPVLRATLSGIAELVRPTAGNDLLHGRATLLISSPGRVTGYHIDAEANYLMQLRGSKTVYVFNGTDPTLLPGPELEAFYSGNPNGARYRPERQHDALALDFRPGCGVHVPVEWPHWVQNGDNVSVSLSINFDLRSNEHRAKVFRVNRQLRRVGFSPSAPGLSAWRDGGKAALLDGLLRMRRLRGQR